MESRTRDFDAVCIKRFFQIIARHLKVLACRNVGFDSNFLLSMVVPSLSWQIFGRFTSIEWVNFNT